MQELFADVGAELVPFLVRAVASLALTLVGAAVEFNALSSLTQGDLLVGGWLVYLGGVALYAGLFVVGPDAMAQLSGAADESKESGDAA